jgi:hypothetical protein
MLLCRFVLAESPGSPRSGIYFDGRFYETDGENAVGVHDAAAVRLLCPVGPPTAIRLMRRVDEEWDWDVADPLAVAPSGATLDAGPAPDELALEVRLAAVANEVDVPEADPSFALLGFTLLMTLVRSSSLAESGPQGAARALGCWLGPFVATPDTLEDAPGPGLAVQVAATVAAGPEAFDVPDLCPWPVSEVLVAAHGRQALRGGELIAMPGSLISPQSLVPGTRVRFDGGPFGVLVGHVA